MRRLFRHSLFAFLILAAGSFAGPATAKDISNTDAALLGQALALLDAGKPADARTLASQGKDPLVRDLVVFFDMTRSGALVSLAEAQAFLDRHPGWPRRQTIAIRAEGSLPPGLTPDQAARWFTAFPPQTGLGAVAYINALVALGRKDETRAAVLRTWRSLPLTEVQEADVYARFGSWLAADDHVARLLMLLDAGQAAAATRQAPRAGKGYPELATARLALQARKKGADKLVEAVPAVLRGDSGLVVDLVEYYQRTDKTSKLDELLIGLGPANAGRADDLWRLRFSAAKRLLRAGSAKKAYAIARDNGLSSGSGFAELEWYAGYIALQRLKDPAAALKHFTRYYDGSGTSISRGKAAYWAALATEAQGKPDVARTWLTRAAEHGTAFYGQLAAARLGGLPGDGLPPMPTLDQTAYKAFRAGELARAAVALTGAGDRSRAALFVRAMIDQAKSQPDYLSVGRLAQDLARWDLVVTTGKAARSDGHVLVDYLFPMPPLTAAAFPEPALVYALIRQESEFDHTAISRADARGLMQLLPSTAKGVAKKLGLAYEVAKLTLDPDYNVTLGRAYLGSLLEDFGGSYVLALAGYNAGPHRATKWIAENGDPRSKAADLVAWVEAIPFDETRNYVMRVAEGVVVYRHLLGQQQVAEWQGYNPASAGLPACCGKN